MTTSSKRLASSWRKLWKRFAGPARRSRRRPDIRLILDVLEDRTTPSLTFLGNELQLGGPTPYTVPPGTAMDAAGDSVVVWWKSGVGVYTGIMGQEFDATGTAKGPAFEISPTGSRPSVAMDASGNFMVAWTDTAGTIAQIYNADGTPMGPEFNVNATVIPYNPDVVATPTGYAVFWAEYSSGNSGAPDDNTIHGARYDASGNLLGTVAVSEAQPVYRPREQVDAGGNFVVVFGTNQGGSGGSVLAQRIDATGNAVGTAIPVTMTTGTDNIYPTVAVQANGDFAAAWTNDAGDSAGAVDSASGVYVRFFHADGTAKTDSIRVGSHSFDAPIPSIAVDGAGESIVSWAQHAANTRDNVDAQLFDPNGNPEGIAFQVNRLPPGSYGDIVPVVATAPASSEVLIAFTTGGLPASINGALLVIGPNHAPVVQATPQAAFTYVKENDTHPPGDTVSFVFSPTISDVDLGALSGIAVTGVDTANGAWQYSLDGGMTWTPFGAVAENAAFLLAGSDQIRFVPNANFLGDATLTYHAWDQTSGAVGATVDLTAAGSTGGTTAFSTGKGTATVLVSVNANYPPVLDPTYAATFTDIAVNATAPPGNTVAQIVGPSITDRNPGDPHGIAVAGVTGLSYGAWQYSLDGGATWNALPSVATSTALLLRPTDMLRFVPNTEFTGTVTISYHAWDETQGIAGGTADLTTLDLVGGAYSAAEATASATVTRFVLTGNTLTVYGTPGNDTFGYGGGYVTLNGESHRYSFSLMASTTINFLGGGGTDTAFIDMSATATGRYPYNQLLYGSAWIQDGFATVSKANGGFPFFTHYTLNVIGATKVYINGAAGDVVQMIGSPAGPNTCVSTPTYSYMTGPAGQFYCVTGVGGVVQQPYLPTVYGGVYAYGNHNPGDMAWFYGSAGFDTFVASGSAYSYLTGVGFMNCACGFTLNQAVSGGGTSVAIFYDSPGNDTFNGPTGAAYLYGPGYTDAAYGFTDVYAYSFVGGFDVALVHNPSHVHATGFAGLFYY